MGIPGVPNFDGLTGHATDAIHWLASLAESAGNAAASLKRIAEALEKQNEINQDIKELFGEYPIDDNRNPRHKAEYTGEALRRHYPGLSNPYGD